MELIVHLFRFSAAFSAVNHTKGLTLFPSLRVITLYHIHRYTHSPYRSLLWLNDGSLQQTC